MLCLSGFELMIFSLGAPEQYTVVTPLSLVIILSFPFLYLNFEMIS